MTKVQILTTCEICKGKAYIPLGEAESYTGEKYIRHTPCPNCEGSGFQPKWVSLAELAALLEADRCPHKHSSFHGHMRFNGGDVWDDIAEVCEDCGTNLDRVITGDYIHDIP